MASGLAVRQTFADARKGFRSRAQFALLDLPVGERQHLQERQRLLCFFVLADVLKDGFGFSVKRNDDRLRIVFQLPNDLGRMRLEVADRLDLFLTASCGYSVSTKI
jgi:hypothetical protein